MVDEKPTPAQLAGVRAPERSHRSRRAAPLEEDATKLQFGDFADGEALTVGEVQTIIKMSRDVPTAPPVPDNKVYKQTMEYIKEFATVDPNTSEAMRAALGSRPGFLNMFEIAQVMHLRPERVEVAVALIPSTIERLPVNGVWSIAATLTVCLDRYSLGDENEDILQSLLDDVRSISRYGTTGA